MTGRAIVVVAAVAAGVALLARAAFPQQPSASPPQASAEKPAVSNEVYQGWKMFHVYCYRCHGTDAVSNPSLTGPDLRQSVKTLTSEEFYQTVHEGRLPKGMPAWGALLTDQQIKNVHAYVEARASGSLKPGRPDEQ